MSSRSLQIFKLLFKERYKDPTLQLIIPTIISGYLFVPAFLIKGDFLSYALVVGSIPLISIPESITFSIALRNIIFVFGDHMNSGSIVSFLLLPIKRTTFFLFTYTCDVLIPYTIWIITYLWYFYEFNYLNSLVIILALIFTSGYFFSTSVVLFYTIILRSSGASTLASLFTLGSIFIVGGFGNYELITSSPSALSFTAFMNPYPLVLAYSIKPTYFSSLLNYVNSGIITDFALALILLLISFLRFKVMEF
ncbi:MAG: hypothetical protein RXR43_05500 [Sulfolobus sp.]